MTLACHLCAWTFAAAAEEGNKSSDPDRAAIALEALSRLKGVDLEAHPEVKTAVLNVLDQVRGTLQFVELVRDFKIKGQEPSLLDIAVKNPNDSVGVEAMRLVLANQAFDLLRASLAGAGATNVAQALGNSGQKEIIPLLAPIVTDLSRHLALRKQAVRALVKLQDGALALLKLAKEQKLPDDLKVTAASELNGVRWPKLKAEAAQMLPPPLGLNAEPLPPISKLAHMKGDSVRGAEVFRRDTVACIKCHQINGQGIDFGPNLSEIGAKLGKDALYESVLNPSAGISFGYEAWLIELKNGDEAYGLIASETADELAIKAVGGIVTHYKKSDIAKRSQEKLSIMPAGLQQTMSLQDLVDLVEYLSSLKKGSVLEL